MSLIQREGRPPLDILPEDSIPLTEGYAAQEDYGDLGMNPMNNPVPLRKGGPAVNGWTEVASNIVPTSGSGKADTEKR